MRMTYNSFIYQCRNSTQVTQELITKFNDAEDFKNLPDDRSLKCYMECQMREMEMINITSATIRMDIILENIQIFNPNETDIFLKMGIRCTRAKSPLNDSCDTAYRWHVCLKKSDIDVSHP